MKCSKCDITFKGKGKLKFCEDCKEFLLTRNCFTCGVTFKVNKMSSSTSTCSRQCSLMKMGISKKKTMLEKYGVENPSQVKEIQYKKRLNSLKKWGVINPAQNKLVKSKIKSTNIEKYGKEHYFQTKEFKSKFKEISLERYGVDNPQKSKEIKERIKSTNIEKYGVGNPFQSEKIKNKIKSTNIEKYGVSSFSQKHIKNYHNYNREKIIEIFNIENNFIDYKTRCEIEEYFGLTNSSIRESLKRMNFNVETHPNISKAEIFIKEWIQEKYPNFEIIFNDRNTIKGINNHPLELDIYIPSLKLAIEYNGSYYHPNIEYFNGLTKEEYKTLKCLEKGIKLFHIWDHEVIETKLENIFNNSLKKGFQ